MIDGGNSFFADTQRRELALRGRGVQFVGMGDSGGAEGARHGPSLMPGGARAAYEQLRPILETIAARTASGSCVGYVGPDGAGHFVKMVHNGIEYGVMQLIADLRTCASLRPWQLMQASSAKGVRGSAATACGVFRIEGTGSASDSSWHLVHTRTASVAASGAALGGGVGACALAALAANKAQQASGHHSDLR